ncbi:MAG: hypothetical protein SF052_17310 [Bacteroidia bacterium]|nr:hypothetical protein [Bacteroidia bacterium]
MKTLKYFCLLVCICFGTVACDLEVIPDDDDEVVADGTFAKKFGTNGVTDRGYSIIETTDKKIVIAGEIRGVGSGGADMVLLKLNEEGEELFIKPFGGPLDDVGYEVRELSTKNYKITGKYTDTDYEKLYSFETLTDGIVSGTPLKMDTQSEGRGVLELSGRFSYFGLQNLCGQSSVCNHFWMFQTDLFGNVVGINDAYGSGVNTLGAAAVVSNSSAGNIYGVGKQYNDNLNQYDPYLIRMPNNFVTLSNLITKDLKETGNQTLNGLVELVDNTFVAVGETENNAQGTSDILFIRFDENLNLVGSPVKIGGAGTDRAHAIIRTNDDKLVIVGETSSKGAGDMDVYLIKTDFSGTILWEQTFGGLFKDGGYDVTEASDGKLLITGYSQNTASASDVDIYVIRASAEGKVQ